jgi:hypothetical protein
MDVEGALFLGLEKHGMRIDSRGSIDCKGLRKMWLSQEID